MRLIQTFVCVLVTGVISVNPLFAQKKISTQNLSGKNINTIKSFIIRSY